MSNNLNRMLQLVDDFFSIKDDPSQLEVTDDVLETLAKLHPETVSEYSDVNGPVCWILMIPTSEKTMELFLNDKISESDILNLSINKKSIEAIYLCSAIVLPEFRNKGIAKQLSIDAIKKMQFDFPIKTLYAWPFSEAGKSLANSIASTVDLPIKFKVKESRHLI